MTRKLLCCLVCVFVVLAGLTLTSCDKEEESTAGQQSSEEGTVPAADDPAMADEGTFTPEEPANTSLVGTWQAGAVASKATILELYDDGSFIFTEHPFEDGSPSSHGGTWVDDGNGTLTLASMPRDDVYTYKWDGSKLILTGPDGISRYFSRVAAQ